MLSIGGLSIDSPPATATLDGNAIELSRKEFDLLATSRANAGPRRHQARAARRGVAAALRRRRQDDRRAPVVAAQQAGRTADDPRFLHTVRGVGVRLTDPTATSTE